MIQGAGFLTGKTGMAILLYYYARYNRDAKMSEYADHLIDLGMEEISSDAGIDFETGLSGTTWAINRLITTGFVQVGEDIFEDIDIEIFKGTKKTFELGDFGDESWKGVYLLSRLQSADVQTKHIWQQRITEFFRHIRQILTLRYTIYNIPVFACKDLLPVFHICNTLQNDDRYTTEINSLCEELPVIVEAALKEERNYGNKYLLHRLLSQLSPIFNRFPEIDIPQSVTLMDVNQFYLNRWIFEIDVPTRKIISDALVAIVEDKKRIDELLFLLHPGNAGLGNYVGGLVWAMVQWCMEHDKAETYDLFCAGKRIM